MPSFKIIKQQVLESTNQTNAQRNKTREKNNPKFQAFPLLNQTEALKQIGRKKEKTATAEFDRKILAFFFPFIFSETKQISIRNRRINLKRYLILSIKTIMRF